MSKAELGTRRVCPTTGRKFYDLNKDPIISPYTGQIVPLVATTSRGRAEPVAKPAAVAEEADAPEVQDAEFVSLEDADAEATGKPAAAEAADDDDIELEEGTDDATFLEEDEEEDDDVSDIIGGDIEDEEET